MKKLKVILVFLLSFIDSANSEEIKVVTEHFPPYQIAEEGKPVRGVNVEFIKALLNEVNVDTDINVYPWARAYSMALTYPNVLIFSISRVPEREHLFHWIGIFPVHFERNECHLYVRIRKVALKFSNYCYCRG